MNLIDHLNNIKTNKQTKKPIDPQQVGPWPTTPQLSDQSAPSPKRKEQIGAMPELGGVVNGGEISMRKAHGG